MSTSKNGLALAICHSLKERFLLLRRNITDVTSCILRKSSSTSFVQRNKREGHAVTLDSSGASFVFPRSRRALRPGKLLENCSA
jgi:hypothetical protein